MNTDKKKLKIAFGRVVKRLRKEANLSQGELADQADLDRTYISLVERALRSPKLETYFAIAQGLNIEPLNLMALLTQELKKL